MKIKTVELNDKKYIITFLDKNNKPCEEENAYMVSISEYDKSDNFIQNALGYINKQESINNKFNQL